MDSYRVRLVAVVEMPIFQDAGLKAEQMLLIDEWPDQEGDTTLVNTVSFGSFLEKKILQFSRLSGGIKILESISERRHDDGTAHDGRGHGRHRLWPAAVLLHLARTAQEEHQM